MNNEVYNKFGLTQDEMQNMEETTTISPVYSETEVTRLVMNTISSYNMIGGSSKIVPEQLYPAIRYFTYLNEFKMASSHEYPTFAKTNNGAEIKINDDNFAVVSVNENNTITISFSYGDKKAKMIIGNQAVTNEFETIQDGKTIVEQKSAVMDFDKKGRFSKVFLKMANSVDGETVYSGITYDMLCAFDKGKIDTYCVIQEVPKKGDKEIGITHSEDNARQVQLAFVGLLNYLDPGTYTGDNKTNTGKKK